MLVALPVSASTYQGNLSGCVISPYEPTQELRQTLDYAYSILDELEMLNNPEWSKTLISIREQLDCIGASFMN